MRRFFFFFSFDPPPQKKKFTKLSPESVACIVALGTKVRSAALVNARITDHIGLTRPFQVYLGIYLLSFFFSFFLKKRKWVRGGVSRRKTEKKPNKPEKKNFTHSGMCVW